MNRARPATARNPILAARTGPYPDEIDSPWLRLAKVRSLVCSPRRAMGRHGSKLPPGPKCRCLPCNGIRWCKQWREFRPCSGPAPRREAVHRLDNSSPHKHTNVRAWATANVELVFLPTYNSRR